MTRKEKYSKERFEKAIIESINIKQTLINMGLRAAGNNYKVFHKYVKLYNIDISHFEDKKMVYDRTLNCSNKRRKIELYDILIENSTYNRGHLKNRLYKEKLKLRKCELCGQNEMWNGKKMSLILDHINGIYNDNRLCNLQIVCPNCNATLSTHCGKNKQIHD